MNHEDFKAIYFNFELAVQQTRLISLVAGSSLKDFPKNLHGDMKTEVINGLENMVEAIMAAVRDSKSEEFNSGDGAKAPARGFESKGPVSYHAVRMLMAKSMGGNAENPDNFEQMAYSQELAMLFAHFDAFLSDCLRVIHQKEIMTLKRGDKISPSAIIDAGSWDALIDTLIEDSAYKFSWQPIKLRIKHLRDEFGLLIDISDDDINTIEQSELLRHLIIHNGGKVSQEYLNRSKRTDVVIGYALPLEEEHVGKLNELVVKLGHRVFQSISSKFFKVNFLSPVNKNKPLEE